MLLRPATSEFYQLHHPWHWLTYGQNAAALGILFASILNAISIVVLTRTLRAVNRQAIAADRQAEAALKQTEVAEQQRIASERAATAAEEQVLAAKAAAAVSDAQRIAAEQSAEAEREHSQIIKEQLLANLRPYVVAGRKPHPMQQGAWSAFAINQGSGVALDVEFRYRAGQMGKVPIAHNVIGAGQEAFLGVNWSEAQKQGMEVTYQSQDGRSFRTLIDCDQALNLTNIASELT